MEKYPLDAFVDAFGTITGRWILFLLVLTGGGLAGIPLGFARIGVVDAAFGLIPPLVSFGLVFLGIVSLLMVYLRLEVRHRLLIGVFFAAAFEGYWVGVVGRGMN